jgi:hypothetical protein
MKLMKISHQLMIGCMSIALGSTAIAGESKAADEKKVEEEAAFIKTMQGFVKAEGLNETIQPGYVCQSGQEVCGQVTGNLEGLLRTRPDFLPDTYNFHRGHPGSTCSYRGKSGSMHYSLHVVCYGAEVAGVHIDVSLPHGFWGKFQHNVRDVAENYFNIYFLRRKNSHTSEIQLARNFTKWWLSYQAAFPAFAAREIPTDAAELLNDQKQKAPKALPGFARSFR